MRGDYYSDWGSEMSKETGGQAFPFTPHIESKNTEELGMTLRDYLAAKAMQSLPLSISSNEQELIANAAYGMADAMLKARNN